MHSCIIIFFLSFRKCFLSFLTSSLHAKDKFGLLTIIESKPMLEMFQLLHTTNNDHVGDLLRFDQIFLKPLSNCHILQNLDFKMSQV
jgi:hypothetical protein